MLALDDTRRNAPTEPPPPPAIARLEALERKHAHLASRALEKARACRSAIDALNEERRIKHPEGSP